jgi:hypothetical protein
MRSLIKKKTFESVTPLSKETFEMLEARKRITNFL